MASSLIDWLAGLLNQRVVDELKVVETVLLRVISKNDQVMAQLAWQRTLIEASKATSMQSLALVRDLHSQLADGSVSPEQLASLAKALKTDTDALSVTIDHNKEVI